MSKANASVFVRELLAWYATHKRDLPWRQEQGAYRIWLSEIVLQQTRIIQGLPYYERIVMRFPTIQDLAKATEAEVLQVWQGLGYYTRARNMLRCAQYIVHKLESKFPTTYKELIKLPGIGPYTAAAIASFAFGERVGVLDGNVYRVLSRVFGINTPMDTLPGRKRFQQLTQSLVPAKSAAIYNQAIMEFGALQCTPGIPHCKRCVLQQFCVAFDKGKQGLLPVKIRSVRVRSRYFYYIVFHAMDKIYVKKRETKDIWQGLYDFYLIEKEAPVPHFADLEDELAVLVRAHNLRTAGGKKVYKHVLTHQRLFVRFFHVYATPDFLEEAKTLLHKEDLVAYDSQKLNDLPMCVLLARFCKEKLGIGVAN